MKKEIVLSAGEIVHLHELGVEIKDTAISITYAWKDEIVKNIVPTLTMQELWRMLPNSIISEDVEYGLYMEPNIVGYRSWSGAEIDRTLISFEPDKDHIEDWTELDLLYRLLCWVAENGYLNKSASTPLNEDS